MPAITAEPGLAEPGSTEPGSTYSSPLILIRRPWLGVTIDGVDQTAITDAACHFGFDQRYATAEIALRTVTGGVDVTYWLPVEISMGASALTAVPRFAGYILPIDNKSWVPGGTLHCRGPLGVAATFGNWDQTEQVADSAYGTDFRELATPNDQEIANAILTYYGLGSHYVYTGGGIGDTVGGTGVLLGTTTDPTKDFEPLLWKHGQTGLDFLDQLDQQCVATDLTQPVGKRYGLYRTFETVGGFATPNIFRTLVTANPQLAAGDANFAFAEGVDILRDLTVTHDPAQVVNAVRVLGYDDGTGPNAYPDDPTTYLSALSPYLPSLMPNGPDGYPMVGRDFTFPLGERGLSSEVGDGFACEDKARQLLEEFNTEVVTVRFSTYREDLFGPAQTIYVYSPIRAGVFQTTWLNQLDITMSKDRVFRQQLSVVVKN